MTNSKIQQYVDVWLFNKNLSRNFFCRKHSLSWQEIELLFHYTTNIFLKQSAQFSWTKIKLRIHEKSLLTHRIVELLSETLVKRHHMQWFERVIKSDCVLKLMWQGQVWPLGKGKPTPSNIYGWLISSLHCRSYGP